MVSDGMGKSFDPGVRLTVPETKVVSDSVEKSFNPDPVCV